MSTNAFPRSRSRVRHQRVPKTPCYDHPRFIQLVKELARIEEGKRKREEPEVGCSRTSSRSDRVNSESNFSQSTNTSSVAGYCPNTSVGGSNFCGVTTAAQAINGYRSLDCNRSTAALHDNYYRQNNASNTCKCNDHEVCPNLTQIHLNLGSNHYTASLQPNCYRPELCRVTNNLRTLAQDDRCTSKCSYSTTTTITTSNLGCPKQSLPEPNHTDYSGSNDLRQDENRTKRKRSTNEPNSNLKKSSASSGISKRHKTSLEPARPLSPSFTKCPICLLDCMDRDPSFTNTCFHLFCYVCIENWAKNKATCPLCRTKFTKIIYNIRSASCFDEKIASPVRRDDDDERIIYEQLQGITTNTRRTARMSAGGAPHLLFDNLRSNDVSLPPFAFVNQIDPRQVDTLHSFNSVTTSSNFNPSVPHTQPIASYNPITGSNYSIALIPSNERIQPNTSSAITSAYTTNTGLTNLGSDLSNRARVSRSGRYIYSRNYDVPPIDGMTRISRVTNTNLNSGTTIERQHHHPYHHNHHDSQANQHRSTIMDSGARQNQRIEHAPLHVPYHQTLPRHFIPGAYSRRPFIGPPLDERILENLYRHQLPDI